MSIAGLSIEYSVGGADDKQALQRLMVAFERLNVNLDGFIDFASPYLNPLFEAETTRQFDDEGSGPNRGSFEALSDEYKAWKDRAHPGKKILELSGTMREALTSSSSPFAVRGTEGSDFNFGTRGVPYASFHQSGTGRMPSRPPFDFSEAFERGVKTAGAKAMRDAVKASKLDEFAEFQE